MDINKPKIKNTIDTTFKDSTASNNFSNLNIIGTEENIYLNDITLDSSNFTDINFT